MSYCGNYLIVTTKRDCQDNMVFYSDLSALPDRAITGKLPLTTLVDKLEADYEVQPALYSFFHNSLRSVNFLF